MAREYGNQNMPKPGQGAAQAPAQEKKEESKPSMSDIEVVALRKGFYAPDRKKAGDKFVVKRFEDLGSWMKCLDPRIQKEHEKAMKSKTRKAGR